MTRIGIPRALLYYQYYPMWRTFFEMLGGELVVSPPTTQAMLAAGSARVVADTCLPVKVFLGHVLTLVDECDWIFIPALRSVEPNVYNCSKFLGLPDMTRAVIPESPPILEIDIDINQGKGKLYQEIYRLGSHFTRNPFRVRQASLAAWETYRTYREMMSSHKLSPPGAIEKMMGAPGGASEKSSQLCEQRATIALVGHPYLLYDDYINHRLISRLEQGGNRVLTPEMVTANDRKLAGGGIGNGNYWTCEEEVVGAGGHYVQHEADGVIGVMAFGCGPDSLMMDTVRRKSAQLNGAPVMCLTMEEHTAEAGLVTRLEAFTDMIYRKKRKGTE